MQPVLPTRPGTARRLLTRRRIALAAACVVLAAGATAALRAPASSPAATPGTAGAADASLTVGLVTPQRATMARTVAASGSVAARDELVIGSDAAGVRLLEVLADVGAVVKRGDLLARGDDATLRAQLAQMEAQARQARAELAQAAANAERAESLEGSGVYSAEALLARRTAREAAAARLELAQAQQRELQVRLAQTRVLAPADGVIAKRQATVGAVVQPGQEMFRLLRDGQLEWLAELPAHALARVREGAAARVRLDDGRWLDASVRQVAPTIDARTRNGVVHVALPRGTPLKAGGHASGEIVVDSAAALTLPEAAVALRDGQPFVYVVGPDRVARVTRIHTGAQRDGRIEVTGGLDAQARVVSAGAGFVKDGERVNVAPDVALSSSAATPKPEVKS